MNKRLLLILIIALVVLVIIAVWKSNRSSAATQQNQLQATQDVSSHSSNGIPQNKNKDEAFQIVILEQLQALQKQPGNITLFLQNFKINCPVTDCDAALAKALSNYPDQTFAEQLKNLLQRLPLYEQNMQRIVLSTSLSPEERFNKIWQLREQTLGKAETQLGFGQERAYADYRFAYHALSQNPNLNTQQRLDAFEALQKQHPEAQQHETSIGLYEQALALIQQHPSDPVTTATLKHELQQRYLSESEQVDIQQREQRVAQQHQRANQYQVAVAQLQQEMMPLKQQMSDAEWQAQYQTRLEALRLQMFP